MKICGFEKPQNPSQLLLTGNRFPIIIANDRKSISGPSGGILLAVTIQEIARHLDLAPSTISKALNDYPHISRQTKIRVFEAARELGYHPSAAARDLRRRRTNRIGFSYGFGSVDVGEYASRMINGAVSAAEKAGYNILLYPLVDDQLGKLERICQTREVEGLLLLEEEPLADSIELLQKANTPFVVLNRQLDQSDVCFVSADYYSATKEAIYHLFKLGHRRIALMGQRALGKLHKDRIASYQEAFLEANLPTDQCLIVSAGTAPGDGSQKMKQLLALPDPPTAVIAIHDPLAIECLQTVTDAGLRVPEDVAIIGSDNIRESQATKPPLTTIHPPLAEIGRQAVEGLLRQLSDASLPPTRLVLPAQLIVRQ